MTTFGAKLKEVRTQSGYTHASRLAADLGISPATYRHWERGTALPDVATLAMLCSVLNISPNDLLAVPSVTTAKAQSARHRRHKVA